MTKMGKPQTIRYDKARVLEEYSVEPKGLIEIKALMGDTSDNIPGVAGVGQKTATDLIVKFGNINNLYDNIDSPYIKQGVREKLLKDKDMAFLSRLLGTISTEAPVDPELESYIPAPVDSYDAVRILIDLEMFSMIERLGIKKAPAPTHVKEENKNNPLSVRDELDLDALLKKIKDEGQAFFICGGANGYLEDVKFAFKDEIVIASCGSLSFPGFIKSLLEDESVKKYTFDSKPLFAHALRNGISIKSLEIDLMLAGYILNPSASSYEPARLAQEYGVQLPAVEKEGFESLAVLPALCPVINRKIEANSQGPLLREIEIPLAKVLASMELWGFAVDENGIAHFGEVLEKRIEEIAADVFSQVGYEFNLNSPKQLGYALFEKLGLPTKKKTKSGYSTNAEVLESLANEHPVVKKILEYRTVAKLKSTYCDGLLKVISMDGRIHSTFNQSETRTGRISSTEPNLRQNIPVRSELGRELRRFFQAGEGCMLIDADYSQIELRVLAHIADDEVMKKAFNDNDDIHTMTASQVFNMPVNMVTPLMRSRAKAVNFGIVYGIGAFSLANDIGVSRAEADRYIKGYLRHYSGVKQYMERVVSQAKEKGYVETLFARRRYLPELAASNANLRAFGERVAMNMPIQGTAADIIKIAMIKVFERLQKERLSAKLIMQVHDELIVEAPENEVEKASKILKEEMENAVKLSVKLIADVHEGKTWYDSKG
jgi:DNA polymerase-1